MAGYKILLTGVTGYVGGRLLKLLHAAGHQVRAVVRDINRVPPLPEGVEVVEADALDEVALRKAVEGMDIAYYLIHGMGGTREDFEKREVVAASNFAAAAHGSGLQRIIYLGGLGRPEDQLSMHLRTRHLTGDLLRNSGIPVTEFRAGVIIGAGAYSFEILRYLVERLPIMFCPRWVRTRAQPIGTRDVLRYLTECLDVEASKGQIIEIGGRDVLSYEQMMCHYAKIRGLRRWMIPLPLLSPRLSARWIDVVTPIPGRIARFLVDGLRNEVIVTNDLARRLFPWEPIGFDEAVEAALERLAEDSIETSWSGASAVFCLPAHMEQLEATLTKREGMVIERHQRVVAAPAQIVWQVVSSIGGRKGWPWGNRLWALRGLFDRLVGGVGMRRGRRSDAELRRGDVIDFWRVEVCDPERSLLLAAEMKLPGKGWLQFSLEAIDSGRTRLVQTCYYEPHGLSGQLYWNIFLPFHKLLFPGMIRVLKEEAEQLWHQKQPSSSGEQEGSDRPFVGDSSDKDARS